MPYQFLEDVTRADCAFESSGKTLSELFTSSATAVLDTMANTKTIKPIKTFTITKQEKTVEKLLFEFLEEIIFLKDRDAVVFCDITAHVDEKKLSVTAELRGDSINSELQELHQDIKAVTMHYYTVVKEKTWKARVVLDL